VVGTKTDIVDAVKLDRLRDYCKTNEIDFLPISSATGSGVKELVEYLSRKIEG
jgi:hypothetical protein